MSTIPDIYYASFSGRQCELRAYDRRLIRKFMMQADIVNAQVSGAGKETFVAITCKDGKTYFYSSDGRLIRKG